MRSKAQTVNGWGIFWLAVLLAMLAGAAGCIPSTAGPSPQRDKAATADQGAIIVTRVEIDPSEAADGAAGNAGNETRKGAETATPFLVDLLKGGTGSISDFMPLMLIIKGAHVAEAFFDKVSKAKVTTTRVEWPVSAGVPQKIDINAEGVQITGSDGEPVEPAPEATPALDQAFNAPALIGEQ